MTGVSIKFDNPEAYDQWMGVLTKIVGDRFLTWLQPNTSKHWIDIGCGNGASTEQILEKCSPSVIDALDPSEDQIKFAKSRKLTKLTNFSIGDAFFFLPLCPLKIFFKFYPTYILFSSF